MKWRESVVWGRCWMCWVFFKNGIFFFLQAVKSTRICLGKDDQFRRAFVVAVSSASWLAAPPSIAFLTLAERRIHELVRFCRHLFSGPLFQVTLSLWPQVLYLQNDSVLDQTVSGSQPRWPWALNLCLPCPAFHKTILSPSPFIFLIGYLGICVQVSFLGSMVRSAHKPSDLLLWGPTACFCVLATASCLREYSSLHERSKITSLIIKYLSLRGKKMTSLNTCWSCLWMKWKWV